MDGLGDDELAFGEHAVLVDDRIRVKIGFYDGSVKFCFHFGL